MGFRLCRLASNISGNLLQDIIVGVFHPLRHLSMDIHLREIQGNISQVVH
jgi:hypothetical protein